MDTFDLALGDLLVLLVEVVEELKRNELYINANFLGFNPQPVHSVCSWLAQMLLDSMVVFKTYPP